MKVFISWSGNRSRVVAEVVSDWIKCVLQASEPWISTRHIERGSLWFSEINEKLRDVSIGIVCLTQENKNKPWILFEAGALAKGLTGSRVCTFLIDLQPAELTDPLAQFNHTLPNESSVWELVRTLNSGLAEKALEERVLEKIFAVYWPRFVEDFQRALAENPPQENVEPRSQDDLLSEILDNTRSLGRRISDIEDREGRSTFKARSVSKLVSVAGEVIESAVDMIIKGASDVSVRDHLVSQNIPVSQASELTTKIRNTFDKKLMEQPELKIPDND
ncbi:hypothetical protein PSFL_22000 [Pseudomonas sp. DD1]